MALWLAPIEMTTQHFAPGIWADADGTLHIDPELVCQHMGVPYTEANERRIVETAKEIFRERAPKTMIVELFDKQPPFERQAL